MQTTPRRARWCATFASLSVAVIAVFAPLVSAQEVEGPVVLKLRELNLEIERQKVYEGRAGAPGVVRQLNRQRLPGGGYQSLTDEQVKALMQDDARRYRERAGALHRGFVDEVQRAAVADPTRVFPVAVFVRFDTTRIVQGRVNTVGSSTVAS